MVQRMIEIALFSSDPILRSVFERLPMQEPTIVCAGIVDRPSALLDLVAQKHVDAVIADTISAEQLADWASGPPWPPLLIVVGEDDEAESREALRSGARAILPRAAADADMTLAIKAVLRGHSVLPHELVAGLFNGSTVADSMAVNGQGQTARLTARERDVLNAMADGASNKAIARRLGISFHTAKFHVAAILAKLDADSRTEAVAKAAQSGLIML
jgi:DNA-binding NarL/FixJ family response regulator